MTTNNVLDDCPFCGGIAHQTYANNTGRYSWFVECLECFVRTEGSTFQNDEYNAKQWNKRVGENK